jgi:hypothetical protein
VSTIYTCQGVDCPLIDEKTGLAIIPFKEPRWALTIKPEVQTSDVKVATAHLCEACVWTIREMLVP